MTGAEFRVVWKLVIAHARRHPGRMLLTIGSTVAAACIVVWVVSGYDALTAKFDEFEEAYLGRYQLLVVPAEGGNEFRPEGGSGLSGDLLAELKKDPAVAVADSIFQTRASIKSPQPSGQSAPGQSPPSAQGPPEFAPPSGNADNSRPGRPPTLANPIIRGGGSFNRGPILVGLDAVDPPHKLLEGRWIDPQQLDRLEGVLTAESARQMNVGVGDQVFVANRRAGDDVGVTVIGIVEQPARLPGPTFRIGLPPSREQALTGGPATAALYVPVATAAKLSGETPKANFIGLTLKSGVQADEFKADWGGRLAQFSPQAELRTLTEVSSEINNSTTVEGVRSQAYAATGISLLAALFIVFTTLSMGVDERIRQFAMLRAIGLTKVQIGMMLAIESLLLGMIGWGGGLLAGWGLMVVMRSWHPDLFPGDASLGMWCILLSGACALGGSLIASIIPAWKATRVRPLDAMVISSRQKTRRFPWIATALGFLLILVNPLLVFYVPMPDTARYAVSAAIGCVSMGLGFVLLAPFAILMTERLFAPGISRLLGINPRLLSTQLSTNLWRTLGITSALTLGLGLFITMQTWGYSMLGPFTPGRWVPDLIVGLMPAGVPESAIDEVKHVKGVIAEECLPLAVEQVKFQEDLTGAKVRATATRQDNCVLVGVDPDVGLGGNKPLFDFQFVEGTREGAVEKLKQGRYCLVPDHFQRESGLGIGDTFTVIPPRSPESPIAYEIAGIVSMDGWHWMSKVGLRNHGGGRTSGLMFADYDQVRKDFGIERVTFFWMNLDGSASEKEIQDALAVVAQAHSPARRAAPEGRRNGAEPPARPGRGPGRFSPSVAMRSADGVREAIRERADGIIWALCQLPLVTLLVTALGVVNTVASSVRARRWDLGVLRSVGLTRSGLFRMIIAEAVLIGISACLLSFGFGVMAGYCGTGVTRYVNVRGGMVTPLVIPWEQIGIGFAMTLGLCLLAALGPAFATSRQEPLRLLQAGRSAG